MSNGKNSSDTYARLEYILSTVNDWLKFAETKNAGMLTLSMGLASIVIGSILLEQSIPLELKKGLGLSLIPLLGAAVLSVFSFNPALSLIDMINVWSKNTSVTDNLLYFGCIKNYTKSEYLTACKLKYPDGILIDITDKYALDLSEQCIVNSKIAYNKYFLFKSATWLFLAAVLCQFHAVISWMV